MTGASLLPIALMLAAQAQQPETSAPPPPEKMPDAAAEAAPPPETLEAPDTGLIEGRRRPGVTQRVLPEKVTADNPRAVRADLGV